MARNPIIIALAVILTIAFPPLALLGLVVLAVLKLGGFCAEESPASRVRGAREAREWYANV